MFCHKCGTEITEGTVFCQRCGAKLVVNDAMPQLAASIPVQSVQPPAYNTQDMPKKKKSKKLSVILGLGIIAIIIFVIINWGGTDYIATVQAFDPLTKLPYTYEEVFNKYMDALEWEVRKDGKTHYVDISGIVKGTNNRLVATIAVNKNTDDSKMVSIKLKSVTIDNNLTIKNDDARAFLYAMFYTYDEKESDLSQLMELTELLKETGKCEFSEIYINEMEGISFKYPRAWTSIDTTEYDMEDNIEMAVVGLKSDEKYGEIFNAIMAVSKFQVTSESIDELFISDYEYAARYLSDVSIIETSVVELDGISARKIEYVDSEDRYIQRYLYGVGTNVYKIELGCENNYARKYKRIFDAIMDSYSITIVPSISSNMEKETVEEIPFGYEEDENYTDYIEWGGTYDGGWLDTTLTFSLYSDGIQYPECGSITTTFRGMENYGKLYYLGRNQFQWENEGYYSSIETYYVCAVYDNGTYQLELYNSDGTYEVTFTLYEQYIP